MRETRLAPLACPRGPVDLVLGWLRRLGGWAGGVVERRERRWMARLLNAEVEITGGCPCADAAAVGDRYILTGLSSDATDYWATARADGKEMLMCPRAFKVVRLAGQPERTATR